MKSLVVAMVVMGVVACGNDDPDLGSGNGTCSQRQGSYIAKYTVRDGTCGPGTETVINVNKQPTSVDAPCTGSISYSSDNCEVTYNSTCPNDGAVKGGALSITGKSKWSADAKTGSATESWAIHNPDGTTLCQGTYDVTITRQ